MVGTGQDEAGDACYDDLDKPHKFDDGGDLGPVADRDSSLFGTADDHRPVSVPVSEADRSVWTRSDQ